MRVAILGPVSVTDQGGGAAVGGARLRVLLVRLALEPGRPVAVDVLVRDLWPEGGPSDRIHALQALVSRLRRVLPEGLLRSLPGGYVLDVPCEAVDALSFERLARDGARALREGDALRASAVLGEALELWRGDALTDAAGLPFADAAAVRLEELRLAATEDRVAADLAAGADPAGLVAELEGLAARHSLRERVQALLVRALHRAGRPAEALAAYERFRDVLAEELGADPGPESREAYLAVLRSAPPERPRGNLRAPSTSFVGREEDRAWIGSRLWEGRLVTLVGPGGAGKTRLATTVAAEVACRFPGGVWLVELAAVAAPDRVPRAVAEALGLRDGTGRRSATELLVDALSPDEALIVLDNCEHVVEAAARLAHDLLGRCPGLRILATGRERLGLDGEALCPVPPMGEAESVRLFGERAAAVRRGFEVGAENVVLVGDICRRLDGLPLAIELAAARLRTMPAEQLAARLEDRFALLGGGARTALPRHRTLRAVVAWSWDLLDGPERRFAARLSVFPGAISPEGAARVGGRANALEALDALADRSLLQVIDGPRPLFRMLETIREYGLEQLEAAGETGAARAAHLACFLDLAERAEPHLRGAGQVHWIEMLDGERDNLSAALAWAVESGGAASAVRLGAALASFWMIQGDHAEAARRLRLALGVRGKETVPGDAAAVALGGYAFNTVLSGGGARDDPLLRRLRPGAAAGHPLAALAEPSAALLDDDPARGLAAVDRRLSTEPDPWACAALHLVRAMLNGNRGAMVEGARDIAAALAGFRRSGERAGLALALAFSAETRTVAGDFETAIAELEESVELLRELGQESGAGMQRVMLAVARARSGDVGRALDELAAMTGPGAATPVRHLVPAHLALGDLARHDGDADEARHHYAAAEQYLARVPSYPQFGSLLETAMAHLAIEVDDPDAARRRLRKALAQAMDAPDLPIAAVAGIAVARLGAASEPEAAAETLGAASVLRGSPDASNPDVVQASRLLRRTLGERAYRDAYAKGAALKVADALALLGDQLRRR
ncbi:ATP-binding protein [Actinomadura nitritigenes]|uniref:ATP-binding protein n=1 Tax=Actinomadura nitritigenes TaxID=134602 RepID=UPI003D8BEF66